MSKKYLVRTCLLACLLPMFPGISMLIASADMPSAITLYESGDYEAAFDSLVGIADEGSAEAQYLLGLMYAQGQGVSQDFYQAGKMYRLAGDQGHAGAQINLGSLFENCYGNGPCNSEKAAFWYRRAADQGNPIAQYNLGVMYGVGEGVAKNEWAAKILLRKSAEQGYAPAQYNLAVTYEHGMGGPVDPVAAYAWYELAANRGYEDGNSGRDRIAQGMDAATLVKARNLGQLILENYGGLENIPF